MADVLDRLTHILFPKRTEIEQWFEVAFAQNPALLYSSVDLRHSGFKIAPVDTNIFPAGFNNLTQSSLEDAKDALQSYFSKHYPDVRKVVIIPENHTRNAGYIANLVHIFKLFEVAGYEVVCGRLEEGVHEPVMLEGLDGVSLISYPLQRQGERVVTCDGFDADLVVLNNDLTSGFPELLHDLMQPIIPHPKLGWYQRRKSQHFELYQQVAERFGAQFGLDSWIISCQHQQCGRVNFKERTGLECVALNVEKLLRSIGEKYQAHGITETPYVFIKADSGTYGMGIMTARSGDDVLEMNKKVRNKMDVIKEGAVNTEVIIQEGIPTVDSCGGQPAEPFIYSLGGQAIGGIWRVNESRDSYISLNASGVRFVPMSARFLAEECDAKSYVYRTIAMLTNLAAAQE